MRRLALPTLAPARVLSACIAGVTDQALQARLRAIEPALVASATTYNQHAQAKTLHLIPLVQNVGLVAKDELKSLYSDHMSATKGVARPAYNVLRNAATKCPLCGVGVVTVLDHHLPKSKYPDLSVCPYNLVPACDFCNNAKRAQYPQSAAEQTIHPYYDDFTADQWIYGRLDILGPPVLIYTVRPPAHWSQTDQARVKKHFEVVKIGHNYTVNANDDMVTLKDHLKSINETKGVVGIQDHLNEAVARHLTRVNSWQHVMYQTLAQNDWFMNGGYRNIPG